ncbi:MAG: DUF2924 domain-containing protein [Deltaproteobacteria bacterium]|nr:DUF2924 domain-containing protein [Deltaproteobacteria bacterium]
MTSKPSILRQLAELDRLGPVEIKERWRALFGTEPPAYNRPFLVKRLAHRIQELAYGGLPESARRRMDDLLNEAGYDENGALLKDRRLFRKSPTAPVAGTRLIREWNGERHEVTTLRVGFEYQGRQYRSLSVIAREITGTRWNGPKFFGLRNNSCKNLEVKNASQERQ